MINELNKLTKELEKLRAKRDELADGLSNLQAKHTAAESALTDAVLDGRATQKQKDNAYKVGMDAQILENAIAKADSEIGRLESEVADAEAVMAKRELQAELDAVRGEIAAAAETVAKLGTDGKKWTAKLQAIRDKANGYKLPKIESDAQVIQGLYPFAMVDNAAKQLSNRIPFREDRKNNLKLLKDF